MEAELGAMSPPVSDYLESSEAGQGQVEHLDPLREMWLADTLISSITAGTLKCQVWSCVEQL